MNLTHEHEPVRVYTVNKDGELGWPDDRYLHFDLQGTDFLVCCSCGCLYTEDTSSREKKI